MSRSINRRTLLQGTGAAALGAALVKPSSIFAAPAVLQGDVTLEVWGGVPPESGPQEICDGFTEATGIKVNYTRYVNDDTGNTQLDTALQGGTPIDVFFTYGTPRLGQRIKAGVALDMADYVAGDTVINDWVTATPSIFSYEGGRFNLPSVREPNFAFINKDKLDAAGAALPEAGWTIAEYMELTKTLTGDNAFGAYSPPDTARETLGSNFWYNADGTASNFDNPAFRENIERHKAMIDDGTAFPWSDVLAQNLKVYAQTPFLTEQTMVWFNSSYSLRFIKDKEQYPHEFVTTFAPFPVPDGVAEPWNPGTLGNDLLIHAETKDPDSAWQFVQYWLKDGAKFMLKAGKIPSVPGTDEDTVVEGILGPDRETLYDIEAYKKVVFDPAEKLVGDTIITAGAEIQSIVEGLTDRYLIGEIDADEWVSEAKSQADAAIAGAA
jgi:multiple sugar transport system substrate-binding protein